MKHIHKINDPCGHHWRKCAKCGESIHRNFKCPCGGDPWLVNNRTKPYKKSKAQIEQEKTKARLRKAIQEDRYDVW